jgi:hypothetical protein
MPYSPIRLEQLNTTQLSGYVLDLIAGRFVLITGDQNIEGVKTFLDGLIGYDSLNQPVISTLDRTLSGNWQYGGQTLGPSGIVSLSFLQNGSYNLPNTVRTTGVQNITGLKTFQSPSTVFGSPNICIVGNGLGGNSDGAGIRGDTDIGVDITAGYLYNSSQTTLNWASKQFLGDWTYPQPTVGNFGIVTPSFLNTGDFNLEKTVRTTGNQTISGDKTFIGNFSISDSLLDPPRLQIVSGSGILIRNNFTLFDTANEVNLFFCSSDFGTVIKNPFGETVLTALYEEEGGSTISGNWSAENLKTNAARINRKVINEASYAVLSSDYYLAVNTSGSAKILSFPQASDNRIYKIKDVAGQATGNAITLSGSGVTFDYQSVYVISDAYASIELIAGSGNNYEVF